VVGRTVVSHAKPPTAKTVSATKQQRRSEIAGDKIASAPDFVADSKETEV
jgi:hypothetical protein